MRRSPETFRPYDASVTARRTLGFGPQVTTHSILAAQADLLDALPGVRIPDLDQLRDRGVLGAHTASARGPRRVLGAGGRQADDSPALPG